MGRKTHFICILNISFGARNTYENNPVVCRTFSGWRPFNGTNSFASQYQYTSLQLTDSLWKLFEILSYEILETKFVFSTQTLVKQQVFMLLAVAVFISWRCKVWKSVRDLSVKNDWGCKVSSRTIFTVKSFIYLSNLHCHRIDIITANSLKMCT